MLTSVDSMKVTIIGGHGKVALLAAPLLVQAGHEVQSIIRNPEHTEAVNATGARAVVLNIEEATTPQIAEILEGQDAVVWSAGAGGGNPDRTYAVDRDAAIRSMNAAADAKVSRYIMVSFARASTEFLVNQDDPFYPYMAAKIAADDHLRASDLEWTVLGPGELTLEAPSGKVAPDFDGEGPSKTSRANVALTIVRALEEPKTIGHTLNYVDGETPIEDWFAGLTTTERTS